MKTDEVKLKEALIHHSKQIVSPNNKLCLQEIIDVGISVKQIRHMSQHLCVAVAGLVLVTSSDRQRLLMHTHLVSPVSYYALF